MIRVLVVSDVRFYRESLSKALPCRPGLTVIGTSLHWSNALLSVGELRPDIVLLDSTIPGGRDIVQQLSRDATDVKVIVIALAETPDDVLDWAEYGIAGYVARTSSLEHLFEVIEATARGELHCSPEIAASMLNRVGRMSSRGAHGPRSTGKNLLTCRECEIVEFVAQGLSNKAIARKLGIRPATAKNHVHNILRKLQVQRRGQAAAVIRQWHGPFDRVVRPAR